MATVSGLRYTPMCFWEGGVDTWPAPVLQQRRYAGAAAFSAAEIGAGATRAGAKGAAANRCLKR